MLRITELCTLPFSNLHRCVHITTVVLFFIVYNNYRSDRLNVVRNYNAPADTLSTGDDQTRPPFVVEFEYMEGMNNATSYALPTV